MSHELIFVALGGTIKSNHANVTLVNNTAKTETVTVPTGRRWYLFGGKIYNGDDVNRSCTIFITDASDKVLMTLLKFTVAATDEGFYPNNDDLAANQVSDGAYPIPLLAGWKLKFTFAAGGASAGGTGEISGIVLEVPA